MLIEQERLTEEQKSIAGRSDQKQVIINRLKEKGCRITKQRLMLLDVILENECSSCKEIYYKAIKYDHTIGTATVYRMVNTLEEIGAISRKNLYKLTCAEECNMEEICTVELDDHTVHHISGKKWNEVIRAGLEKCGYVQNQNITSIVVKQCDCNQSVC